MFGWKAKYMQIEAEYFKLRETKLAQDTIIYNNEKAICEMVDTIHDIDQLIFRMSRCTTWSTMRPLFNQLQHGQKSRAARRKEFISVYTKKD